MMLIRPFILCLPLFAFSPTSLLAASDDAEESFFDLGLEDLLSMEITSVSKKKQKLNEAAAAVYVITGEDIQRSGVTTIADALRMVPGLQVARIDSNKWAVSSRGFNGQFANKLLVLMDGRSVYTPSYSGVYWENQDTMLEDIERIEVIRGPGATLWGANAVNGVINIITKTAEATVGSLLVVGRGDEEDRFSRFRHGFDVGEHGAGRFYFKLNQRDSSYAPGLDDQAGDNWQSFRGGFRIDLSSDSESKWTVQGDFYQNDLNQIINLIWLDPSDPANNPPDLTSPYQLRDTPDKYTSRGKNILARWNYRANEDSLFTLQAYLDSTDRKERVLDQSIDTLDIDFQHQYRGIENHDIVWGLGYRRIEDKFVGTFQLGVDDPAEQTTELLSAFVQDEIGLAEDLYLTLGSKLEETDYTGTEVQPSARVLWRLSSSQSLWSALSRAVRTPSAVERRGNIVGFIVPGFGPFPTLVSKVDGSDDFDSEDMTAFEVGYRLKPSNQVSIDLAFFHNQYDDVLSFETTEFSQGLDPDNLPNTTSYPTLIEFSNKRDVATSGIEALVDWYATENWRIQTAYTYTDISDELDSDSNDNVTNDLIEGSTPEHQLSIRSYYDFSDRLSLNAWLYYVDELKASAYSVASAIDSYVSMNLAVNWKPAKHIELSFVGQNLNEDRHAEFIGENFIKPTELERSAYVQLTLDF